jgi:hypothetical protein
MGHMLYSMAQVCRLQAGVFVVFHSLPRYVRVLSCLPDYVPSSYLSRDFRPLPYSGMKAYLGVDLTNFSLNCSTLTGGAGR